MVNLYIASKENAGKTALCAGIGRKLLSQGKKIGYFRPVCISSGSALTGNRELTFLKEALGLEETSEVIAPVNLSSPELWGILTNSPEDFNQRVKNNHLGVAKGKDVVIIEGLSGLAIDNVANLACYKIAETLDARVVILLRDSASLAPSDIARVAGELGQGFLGVVVNFVPQNGFEARKQKIADSFQKAGIKVLGILPEERALLGVSVKELADALGGEIITSPENAGELVENIMLGAMTPDSALYYFNRKKDKAAIIRGDRPDMQLAALQTPTRCLVLTGNTRPQANVVLEAEDKHVPIIIAPQDISGTVADVEKLLAASAFTGSGKLKKLEQMLDKYLDFKYLYSALNL
jgi:BioD-like phosphotransacetylase family protein